MFRIDRKSVFLSLLAVVCLLPASSLCFSSLGNLVLASIDWMIDSNHSQEPERVEPMCSCSIVTQSCSLYILHDAPEPYCPTYTRYCCELEAIAALLLPRNDSEEEIWATRAAAVLTKREKGKRAVESCKCTNYLLPCPVEVYLPNRSFSELFECSFFHRFCCDGKVLTDAILPFVANPYQEPSGEDTRGQENPQDMGNETDEDPGTQGSDSWWWPSSWLW